jgi:hypothetical protein
MAIRTNEENAGNPVHLGLTALCFFIILLPKSKQSNISILYAAASVGTIIIFSAVFKWQVFSSRYHMPFFILVSPFVGLILQKVRSQILISAMGTILFISAFPWFFSIDSRPIIPTDRSLIGSILTTPREEILFANAQFQKKSYQDLTNLIKGSNCRKIGLSLGGIQTEYLVWDLMGAPQPDLEFQWFVAGTSSEKYRDFTFRPCAVICERCTGPGSDTYNGLPVVYENEVFKLYLAEEQ